MSVVELRRNSSPHLGSLATAQSAAVWRKSSHPPLSSEHSSSSSITSIDLSPISSSVPTSSSGLLHENRSCISRSSFASMPPHNRSIHARDTDSSADEASSQQDRPVTPGVYDRMLMHSDDMKSLIQSIADEAKRIIHSETCSVFILDREKNLLISKVFEKADALEEIRVPLGQGVVGKVASTKTIMNVRDVHRCPFFYPNVDELTGFHTKNILCFPIIDNAGTFVGVVELCNRIGKHSFSRHDEQKARTFAVYCATSVSHCLLYQKVLSAQGRTHMATELVVQGSQFLVSEDEIRRLLAEPIHEWRFFHSDFAQFSFSPRSIGNSQTYEQAALSMFQDLGFVDRYHITKRRLVSFVLRVSKGYREVPYHNWSHAFAVAHFCWLCLRTETARRGLDELERFALLIACLCHDIDHRGTTNSFQLQSKTPLAQLYSSEGSVLERHHYAQTVAILQMEDCNVLESLTNLQYKTVLSHIREVILATDIAVHLQKVDRIQNMVNNGYNSLSHDHHYLFRCLMITSSDLSDQSKDFRNSKAIAENIYREFFSQGDIEKLMGASPVAMMDREKACVPQIQLNFMDTIAVPVFEMLSKIIPEGLSTYRSIQHNRRCWKTLHEISEEIGHPSNGGLEYLRDEELESQVIARVKQEDQRLQNTRNHTNNTDGEAISPRLNSNSSHSPNTRR